MKIGIDISQVVYGTGVSVYTKNLVSNLLKVDRENEYVLFAGTLRRKAEVLRIFPQAKVFPIPPTLADILWNRFHVFPVERLVGGLDVFHSSDWTEPPSRAFKVTTVHDLIPIKFARFIHPVIASVHMRRLEWVKHEADRIIVPSLSAMEDLVEFGVGESKIRVIPESNSVTKSDPEDVVDVKRKYKISGRYILSIGSSFYKNIENSIKAFELGSAGKDLKLVVIGRQSNTYIRERRNIRFTGFVSDREYAALCTGAEALLFPSLYEGFGIAILDAFSCGTPVITSDIASMPEVAGDAAVLVDPTKVESIAEGIGKVLRGPKGYIEKGYKRVKEFSWEKTAKMTLDVYNEMKNTDM